MLNGWTLDARQAARGLWKARGLSAAVIVTLALGTGAATAMFGVLRATLLRDPPFRDPERLVVIGWNEQAPGQPPRKGSLSNRAYEFVRDNASSFEGVAAHLLPHFNVAGYDQTERVQGEVVSGNYLGVLGVTAAAGRGFVPEDDSPGAAMSVIISDALWRRRFGADPATLNRPISINRVPMVVAGIMPRGFQGLGGEAQLWITRAAAPAVAFPYRAYAVTARLRPGRTVESANAELAVLSSRFIASFPDEQPPDVRRTAHATPLTEARIDPASRAPVAILFGAVGVLLLIACANVANLLLVRAQTREREVAVRLAMGTSRGRLIRLLLTESGLLATLGGLAGLTLGWIAINAIGPWMPARAVVRGPLGSVGGFSTPGLDLSVLGFTWAVIAAVTILFGLAPALRAARTEPVEALKTGTRSTASHRFLGLDAYAALTVCEIALATILLAGSGLLLRSFWRLASFPLGFETRNVVTFQIQAPAQWYGAAESPVLVERLVEAVSRVPGVEHAAASYYTPFDPGARHGVRLAGGGSERALVGGRQNVTPGYFETLGIPVIRGRPLTRDDRRGRPLAAVVSQSAASRFWPGEDPIGKRLFIGMAETTPPDSALEVVGLAADVNYRPSQWLVEPNVYTSYYQFVSNVWAMVLVRSPVPPGRLVPALRDAVRAVDANLPIAEVQTLDERGGNQIARQRLNALVLTVFAALALAIAAVGVYGVVSQQSQRRTREYGVRIALGAESGDVLRMVLARALVLIAVGLGIGVPGALALSRLLAAQLYQIPPTDPLTYIAISAALGTVALIASYLPARRAARGQPLAALRAE